MSGQSPNSLKTPDSVQTPAKNQNLGLVLLHSARNHPIWANRSIEVEPKAWYRFCAKTGSSLTCARTGERLRPASKNGAQWTNNPWHDLRSLLNDERFEDPWAGYFSYELLHWIETKKLPQQHFHDWPLIEIAAGNQSTNTHNSASQVLEVVIPKNEQRSPIDLDSNFTRAQYEAGVQKVKDYIAAGDVFQVNLAQKLTSRYKGCPRKLFQKLMTISPAWYGAYLELPDPGINPTSQINSSNSSLVNRVLLSTSPELFLKVERGHVITRPIKGTRPAGTDAAELEGSEKDAAELHMIIDLMRNDLGKVCEFGSVKVTQGRTIESHPTVHHGVATIEGDLHPKFDMVDLLKATLPGGSITGAPKVRAMQIIQELEPNARGPYCGAIGYISKDSMQLSIAIRTMMLNKTAEDEWDVDFSVGGGIVADSDPASEYQETLDKAEAIYRSLKHE